MTLEWLTDKCDIWYNMPKDFKDEMRVRRVRVVALVGDIAPLLGIYQTTKKEQNNG